MTETFDNIEYLKSGTERQKQAYSVLTENEVLQKLKPFSPILVGTIPINIDIESSDLDIICYWKDKNDFISHLKKTFCGESNFEIRENQSRNSVVANFILQDFEIEIFGQNIPVKEQFAYQHLIIENNLLRKKGDDFRTQIIELKKQGYKTEPAFAAALGLTGNPYIELLSFENSQSIFYNKLH